MSLVNNLFVSVSARGSPACCRLVHSYLTQDSTWVALVGEGLLTKEQVKMWTEKMASEIKNFEDK